MKTSYYPGQMHRSIAAFCLLLAAAPQRAGASDLTSLLPENPTIVIGARLRSLLESDLFRTAGASQLSVDQEWRKLAQTIGFDPTRDVDELVMAATGTGDNPPFLMAAHGRFNLAVVPASAQRYRGVALLDGGKGALFALLDSETALAGDGAEVRAAIDRRDAGGTPPAALARVADMRSKYDVWGFGGKPSGFMPAKTAPPTGLEGVDRFEFGMLWSNGLQLSAALHFSDLKAAAELSKTVMGLQALVQMQQPAAKGLKLDTRMEGKTLHFAIALPEAEMKKMLASRTVSPQTTSTPAKPAGPPVALPLTISAPVAPSTPGENPTVVKLPGGR